METTLIEINGCVELPAGVTHGDFVNAFCDFLEANGWHFGGGTREIEG